jgi:hypothetical protein
MRDLGGARVAASAREIYLLDADMARRLNRIRQAVANAHNEGELLMMIGALQTLSARRQTPAWLAAVQLGEAAEIRRWESASMVEDSDDE